MLHETVKIVPIIELTPLKYLFYFILVKRLVQVTHVYLFTQRRGFTRNGFAERRATVSSGVSHSTVYNVRLLRDVCSVETPIRG